MRGMCNNILFVCKLTFRSLIQKFEALFDELLVGWSPAELASAWFDQAFVFFCSAKLKTYVA